MQVSLPSTNLLLTATPSPLALQSRRVNPPILPTPVKTSKIPSKRLPTPRMEALQSQVPKDHLMRDRPPRAILSSPMAKTPKSLKR